jgi:hypothetical protein
VIEKKGRRNWGKLKSMKRKRLGANFGEEYERKGFERGRSGQASSSRVSVAIKLPKVNSTGVE